jgi:ferredoxin-thioredoxin reductase catalytic subunit
MCTSFNDCYHEFIEYHRELLCDYFNTVVNLNYEVLNKVIKNNYYCICRFERTKKTLCPCVYHLDELRRYGRCKCGLFIIEK